MSATTSGQTCPKCRENLATLPSRAGMLCKDCYIKYIKGKVGKSLSVFRARRDAPPRKVLLALSFGLSSLSLLQILAGRLHDAVERVGSSGAIVDVLVMDDTSVFRGPDEPADEHVQRLWQVATAFKQTVYPMIRSYAWRCTQTCFDALQASDANADLTDVFEHLNIEVPTRHEDGNASQVADSPYQRYIGSLASLSAQIDANAVLTRRFIVDHAKKQGCEAILWGDTTTRLAERTLGEAAKGRGFSMPWQTSDGPTPYGVDFIFPMRELLRKEIVLYADLTEPALTTIARQEKPLGSAKVSSKDASIDALMMQYFQSVEENFPSIVTNVVRTTSRLRAGDLPSDGHCQVCGLPVPRGTQGLHNWAGSQDEDQAAGEEFLCYGCARTAKGRRLPNSD